jgi:lysophospholipase L1-like esterase
MSFKNVISFFAGGPSNAPAWPAAEQIGNILTTNFSSLTGWTDTSTNATFTPSGGGLLMSGGNESTWVDDIITYNYAFGFEEYEFIMEFVMTTAGSIALGMESVQKISTGGGNGLNRSFYGHCSVSGGNYYAGVVTFQEGKYSVAYVGNQSAGSAISNGDSMRITFTRSDYNNYVCFIQNITKGTTQTATYRQSYPTILVPNVIGRPGLHAMAGAQTVTSYVVNSTSYKNVRAAFLGDSITQAYYVNGVTQGSLRYAARTFSGSSKRYEVNAGGNHGCAEILSAIESCKLLNPEFAIMMIGGNDVYAGTSTSVYYPQYTSIRNEMAANGSTVVHLLATPRDATNMTTFNAWISSTFASDIVIDTFTPLKDGGTGLATAYDLDGTHPNQAGMQLIADTILSTFPVSLI